METMQIISRYTRAEAIEDGVLVDVSTVAREAGFKYPVALTRAVWVQCVEVPEGLEGVQDEQGRLWDVLWMLLNAIRRSDDNGPEIRYKLIVEQGNRPGRRNEKRTSSNYSRRTVTLKAVCGPGDELEPVMTIMQPNED